ncbi:MAG: tetratricopeptide repeat protein, partial [Pirellulales bacterium]|nr:tetratricopeptide repeat protein [Pirellulales bacterium]
MIRYLPRHFLLPLLYATMAPCLLLSSALADEDPSLPLLEATPEEQVKDPPNYESLYNQGVAAYRDGNYEDARQLFTRSTAVTDRQLEAKARFNLANCEYSEAVTRSSENPEEAIAKLETAISHYRGAIEANPQDPDARANAELAQLLIEQLKQEQEQQNQDEQNQDQQNQDEQNQDEQNQDEQNQDQEQQDQEQQDQEQQN